MSPTDQRLESSLARLEALLTTVESKLAKSPASSVSKTSVAGLRKTLDEAVQLQRAVRSELRAGDRFERMAQLGTWEWYPATGQLRWSEEEFRLYGLEPESYRPAYPGIVEQIHPSDRSAFVAALAGAVANLEPGQLEFRVLLPEGGTRDIRSSFHASHAEPGREVSICGVDQDISVLSRSREELRQAKELAQQMVNSTPDGVYAADQDLRIIAWNPAMERISGRSAQELLGRHFLEVFPSVADHGEDRRLFQALSGRTVVTRGIPFPLTHTGDRRYFDAYYTPVCAPHGEQTGIQVIVRDVTAVHRAHGLQNLLLESGRRFLETLDLERVLETAVELVVPGLADWCVVFAQPEPGRTDEHRVRSGHRDPDQSRRLQGFLQPSRLLLLGGVGEQEAEFVPAIPSSLLRMVAGGSDQLQLYRDLGLSSFISIPLTLRDRTVGRLFLANAQTPLTEDEFVAAKALGLRLAAAVENCTLLRQAHQATRDREELMAVLSHDLRSPLAAIRLKAGMLAARTVNAPDDARVVASARTIDSTATRMAELIDALLDATKLQEGRLPITPVPCSVSDLVAECSERFGPLADRAKVQLSTALSVRPGTLLECDRVRLMQVLSNLLSNALRYSPAGSTIRVEAADSGERLRFTVADGGPGVPEAARGKVFQKHWQGQGAGSGVGLGLYIAKGIVEAHGGSIWVEAHPGPGARFSFELPQSAAVAGRTRGGLSGTEVPEPVPSC